jgi:hypothetical protein
VFDDLFDEFHFSRGTVGPSRHPAPFRVAFGVLGVALSVAGVVRCASFPSAPFRAAAAGVFVGLACVCPLVLFAASLPALFLTRLVFVP